MDKPIWREWIGGESKPSDWVSRGGIMYKHGVIERGYSNFNWRHNTDDCYPIVAYQTTRTKAAKYVRAKCYLCEGTGDLETPENVFAYIYGVFEKDKKCPCCNGKGHTLERIK